MRKKAYTRGFEVLDKWKHGERDVGPCLVFEQNKSRAENTGFPSVMEVGKQSLGLSEHQVAAVLGWTTGDYRLINPIARGQEEVEFEDYPGGVKTRFKLHRAEVMPYIYVLNSALQQLPVASGSTQRLFRGHRREVAATEASSRQVILLQLGRGPENGTSRSLPVRQGFTSVSYDMESALKFATQANQGRSAKRSLLEYRSGRSIAKLSARKGEVEVLFPQDTYFEVLCSPADAAHLEAAKEATAELQKAMPEAEAEVQVVYLREVARPEDATQEAEGLMGQTRDKNWRF
eukprot:s3656_g7.t1